MRNYRKGDEFMKLPSIWLLFLALICRVVFGERVAVFLFYRSSKKSKKKITIDEFCRDSGEAGIQAFQFP